MWTPQDSALLAVQWRRWGRNMAELLSGGAAEQFVRERKILVIAQLLCSVGVPETYHTGGPIPRGQGTGELRRAAAFATASQLTGRTQVPFWGPYNTRHDVRRPAILAIPKIAVRRSQRYSEEIVIGPVRVSHRGALL
ncbi:hypothetical protein CC80DRAFT_120596 [Byssothecium circinans]|uniref:Uncharacterized protein n=1 Tax=Byssothecium circinans TaxID=147558 RepID=A0A6A5TS39_9PLEO|nr:hypothetical protein CC80DRAFT_120596 [Byssothecium circinans]